MIVIDPGHIYELTQPSTGKKYLLKFIKRSGGAIFYVKEWPGIQTQAVMRALIDFLQLLQNGQVARTYYLWQLGTIESHPLTLETVDQAAEIIDVLVDRSRYLNSIISCVETGDACSWLEAAKSDLKNSFILCQDAFFPNAKLLENATYCIRMALWNYEARAYRRKQESVNREKPTHDDSARPRSWRYLQCDDVPFNEEGIELRPIGDDGHIVVTKQELTDYA